MGRIRLPDRQHEICQKFTAFRLRKRLLEQKRQKLEQQITQLANEEAQMPRQNLLMQLEMTGLRYVASLFRNGMTADRLNNMNVLPSFVVHEQYRM